MPEPLLSRRYPAQPDSVPAIRHAVIDALTLAGFVKNDLQFRVALTVTEATANIVRHAYPNGTPPGDVDVQVDHTPTRSLAITITDHGVGMNTRTDAPGMGLGLHVMNTESTTLHIESDANGTTITLHFDTE